MTQTGRRVHALQAPLLLSASGEPVEVKTYTYRTAFACRAAERMQRDAHVKLPEGVMRKVYCRRGR